MTDKTAEQIKAEILATMAAAIDRIEQAIIDSRPDEFIHAWPNYNLGIKFDSEKTVVVDVASATITTRSDRRSFRNGAGTITQVMPRRQALTEALASYRKSITHLTTMNF